MVTSFLATFVGTTLGFFVEFFTSLTFFLLLSDLLLFFFSELPILENYRLFKATLNVNTFYFVLKYLKYRYIFCYYAKRGTKKKKKTLSVR